MADVQAPQRGQGLCGTCARMRDCKRETEPRTPLRVGRCAVHESFVFAHQRGCDAWQHNPSWRRGLLPSQWGYPEMYPNGYIRIVTLHSGAITRVLWDTMLTYAPDLSDELHNALRAVLARQLDPKTEWPGFWLPQLRDWARLVHSHLASRMPGAALGEVLVLIGICELQVKEFEHVS
jgi:hypothetical protein